MIAAHSRKGKMQGREEATACGLAMQQQTAPWNRLVRVTSKGSTLQYMLDRMD